MNFAKIQILQNEAELNDFVKKSDNQHDKINEPGSNLDKLTNVLATNEERISNLENDLEKLRKLIVLKADIVQNYIHDFGIPDDGTELANLKNETSENYDLMKNWQYDWENLENKIEELQELAHIKIADKDQKISELESNVENFGTMVVSQTHEIQVLINLLSIPEDIAAKITKPTENLNLSDSTERLKTSWKVHENKINKLQKLVNDQTAQTNATIYDLETEFKALLELICEETGDISKLNAKILKIQEEKDNLDEIILPESLEKASDNDFIHNWKLYWESLTDEIKKLMDLYAEKIAAIADKDHALADIENKIWI